MSTETLHPYIARTLPPLREALVGKKIAAVDFIDKESCDELGWDDTCVVITLEDGTQLFPSMDDEGNNAGALFTTLSGPLETIATVPA